MQPRTRSNQRKRLLQTISLCVATGLGLGFGDNAAGQLFGQSGVPVGNGVPVGSPYTTVQNGIVNAPATPYQQPVPNQGLGGQPGVAYQNPPGAYNTAQPSYGTPMGAPVASNTPGVVVPIAQNSMPPFNSPMIAPGPMNEPLPRLNPPWQLESNPTFMQGPPFGYNPRVRDVPLDVYLQEGQTGRFTIGGAVNSDLGVTGNVTIEERNFDIRAWPNSQRGLLNGAFRGAGQNFRMELMPGNLVQRYTVNWTEPNIFGYSPFSLSVGGFYFTRIFQEWTEQRLGGRVGIGYEVTEDLSLMTEINMEDVKIFDPAVATLPRSTMC